MVDGAIKKTSLFKETFVTLKATASEWWPWMLVFGLFFGILQVEFSWLSARSPFMQFMHQHPELQGHPEVLKKNKELMQQYMTVVGASLPDFLGYMSLYVLGTLVLEAVAFYIMTVMQMRFAFPATTIEYSVRNFFYWFGKVLWKYIRPVLWVLLPIIGMFFYLRSTIHYTLVGPLAILRKGDELKTSWAMAEGNWWRIFGNEFAVILCLMLIVICVSLVPGVLVLAGGTESKAAQIFMGIWQGAFVSLGVITSTTYATVAYRVLLVENQSKMTPPTQEEVVL